MQSGMKKKQGNGFFAGDGMGKNGQGIFSLRWIKDGAGLSAEAKTGEYLIESENIKVDYSKNLGGCRNERLLFVTENLMRIML